MKNQTATRPYGVGNARSAAKEILRSWMRREVKVLDFRYTVAELVRGTSAVLALLGCCGAAEAGNFVLLPVMLGWFCLAAYGMKGGEL